MKILCKNLCISCWFGRRNHSNFVAIQSRTLGSGGRWVVFVVGRIFVIAKLGKWFFDGADRLVVVCTTSAAFVQSSSGRGISGDSGVFWQQQYKLIACKKQDWEEASSEALMQGWT